MLNSVTRIVSLPGALETLLCLQNQCPRSDSCLLSAMSSDSDTPIGSRLIVADRQASKASQFDGNWLSGKHVVTILASTCSTFPDFQIDANSRTCAGTLKGKAYTGKLQNDGLGITWCDGDTWTLMEADRTDKEEHHTATESANSEDSGKRERKNLVPDRHRHRRRRHHRSRTRREDVITTSNDRIVNTRKKTDGNTVTLTNASTWIPQSPSPAHTEITLTKYNRKHPAGARPNPPAKRLRITTTAQPAPYPEWTYAPSNEKEEQEEATRDPEIHFVVVQQTNADSGNTTVQNMPLSPPNFNGRWSTSAKTTVTIINNTCEIFQSFACNPNWRSCFGRLGTRMLIGSLSSDGRVIHWDNGNTWLKLDSLHLTASYSLTEQSRWGYNDLTTQHPAFNNTQHLTPHRAVEATNSATKTSKIKANVSLPDTPRPKKPRPSPAAHTDEHLTIMTDSGTAAIRIGAYDVLGRQLTFTLSRQETWTYKANQPTGDMVILDCTNLKLIHHSTPSSAHGSTKDIYAWLDKQEPNFPTLVKQSLQREGDAALHTYTHKGQPIWVIHVINPDFRETADVACKVVAEKISLAFSNIFAIFLGTKKQHLRIQPIAGGLYAGSFLPILPTLTVAAMTAAFQNLASKAQETLSRCKLELCVTYQEEHKHYAIAFKNLGNKSYEEQTKAAQQQLLTQQQRSKPKFAMRHEKRPHPTAPALPVQYHQL